jgi:O-antigen/teichoic acid export membrane protein
MNLIAKNLVALAGSQFATWGLSLVLLVVVPHYLGDTQFGDLSFASSFVGLFALVASLGTMPFIIKETARDPSRVGIFVFNALVMKLVLAIVLGAAAIAMVHVLGYPPQTRTLVAAVCLGMLFSALNGPLVAGLQGEQRMGRTAVWTIVQRYAAGLATLVVLATHSGLVALALASGCTGVIALAANGAQLRSRLRGNMRLDLRLWKFLALGGLPFLVWDLASTIYGTIDVTMLSLMAGDAVVGWYVLAYKLVGVPGFLPSIFLTVLFPALSALGVGNAASFARLANRALRVIFFVSAPMAVGIAFVAADLLHLLRYPVAFEHSVLLIRIIAVHIPLVGLDTVMGALLMANDRQKQWTLIGCLAAVLNPLLNLVAIPLTMRVFGDGAIGASVVTVTTELFMFAGAVYLRPAGVLDRQTCLFLARCLLACAFLFAALFAARTTWLPVKVVMGIAVYGLASMSLRTVSLREVYRVGMQYFAPARLRRVSSVP